MAAPLSKPAATKSSSLSGFDLPNFSAFSLSLSVVSSTSCNPLPALPMLQTGQGAFTSTTTTTTPTTQTPTPFLPPPLTLPLTPTQERLLDRQRDEDKTPTAGQKVTRNGQKPLPGLGVEAELDDGPLFRACALSLLKRASSLKSSEKRMVKLGEASLAALTAYCVAQQIMDDELESLCSSTNSSNSDVLVGVWSQSLRVERWNARQRRETERTRLETMLSRMRDSVDRLRYLETKRKAFEADSKAFYSEIGKYLARTDTDPTKLALADTKQAQRMREFKEARLDYFSCLESIVESEEQGLASWLRMWAGIPDDLPVEVERPRADIRKASREENRQNLARSMTLSVARSLATEERGGGSGEAVVSEDEEGEGGSTPSGSGISQNSVGLGLGPAPNVMAGRRRRRPSIQGFEKEGTADRIKGFIKTSISSAQSSLQHPRQVPRHGHSRSVDSATSPTLMAPSHSAPASRPLPPTSPPIRSSPLLSPPPAMTKQQIASLERKKEGVLWATAKPTGHTTTGDGGGTWHNTWTVLSEGQLVEFVHWKTSIEVRNAPINLRYATARLSRNSERRFCFEVITPQARRIYQALSDQDVKDWVSAISKSIESLLNGTSSVRYFDPSRLLGSSAPYNFSDFGSTTSLVRDPPPPPTVSQSPPIGLGHISNRLPSWGDISRRASLGANRHKASKEPVLQPSKNLGPAPSLLVRSPSSDLSARRRHFSVQSESGISATPAYLPQMFGGNTPEQAEGNGLRPSGANFSPFMTIGRRSLSGSSEGAVGDSDRSDGASDQLSINEEDQWIASAVEGFAVPPLSDEDVAKAKMRRASKISDLVDLPENSSCADCGASDPRWASWSLGIYETVLWAPELANAARCETSETGNIVLRRLGEGGYTRDDALRHDIESSILDFARLAPESFLGLRSPKTLDRIAELLAILPH
ncbi:hypothetical protein P7C70_g7813, partial [Phenoliferia sp. Uapishka_3]